MQQSIPGWFKILGLGVLAYQLFYTPRRWLRQCAQEGIVNLAWTQWGQWQMERAVDRLAPIACSGTEPALEVHFLTGRRFWYQSCFCMYSLLQQSHLPLRPVFYDDGSLTPENQRAMLRLFPQGRIVSAAEIQAQLDAHLPADRFPVLRSRRLTYPNLRKLTDIHIGSAGWKLVLDSDMLFFHPPHQLLEWLQNPQQPCHMVDVETAYGYSPALMQFLADALIPERINVGITGLDSGALDWEELEFWCDTLIEQEGTHYFQEQALIAMLMARQPCTVVPAAAYIVRPDRAEVLQPAAILHHYVSTSKAWYFRHGWQHIIRN